MSSLQNHFGHAFGIAPLFLYVGLYKEAVPEHVFTGLGILGLVVLAYHSYRAYGKLKENRSAWINWIHIFLIAPLLLILGYLKKDANSRYFEMMLLLGFAAFGYHALYLIRDSMLM
jgi:hypothetical protein